MAPPHRRYPQARPWQEPPATGGKRPVASLVGRDQARARLAQLIGTATAGRGGALVVRGAAGIGKTALLDDTAARAADCRVVHVSGVGTEADLPYATLHLLCSALGAEPARLGHHGRDVLETAIGLRMGPVPDRLPVGVALVDLLTLAAAERPLVCVVDDVQWLDAASADVLAFAARRLAAVPVALVLADRGKRFAGLPELVLDPLGYVEARRLFEAALPAPMDPAVVDRVVAEAAGNPLVLVESARAGSPAELAGGYGVPAIDVADGALLGLAAQSRLLLVLAAAEPLGDPARLWRAATRLGVQARAAEQLEAAGLVSFGPWVTFRDPRLRWSVYALASPVERRRVHEALADATDPATEPDRNAWHRAHGRTGPDDAVADAVAGAVHTARQRGGSAAAAAFLAHAALCTAEPGLRARRAIAAAEAHHAAGAADVALRLLAVAELSPLGARQRARLGRVRARIAFDARRDRDSVAGLLAAAQDLDGTEPHQARAAYLEALGAAIYTGHRDVVDTALARLAAQVPKGTDRLLEGVAQRCTGGFAAAVEPLKLALKTLDCDHEHDPRSRLLACLVAPDLWDDRIWLDLTDAELAHTRALGARATLPYILTHRALVEVHIGHFAAARALVDEAAAVSAMAGTPPFPNAAVVLAAWSGEEHPLLAVTERPYHAGEGMTVTIARYAKAVLCNGLGAYADAVAATRQSIDGDGLELHGWSLAELVEAAVRSGDPDTAARAHERLAERAWLCGTDWALGVEARSRALLDDGVAAERSHLEAIDRLGRTMMTTHLARAQLNYGEWLRRQGRRVDARVRLRAAHESFTAMGAEAFAGRALRELLATGEHARRRVEQTRNELTPQETRIASLARDGRSNPDIATQLSISPRTVEYHLHKVFTKLGITSRTELHLVLPGTAAN